MSKTSYTLLLHKSELSYTGNPVRVDIFSGNTQNLHTVSVQYSNFVGRFYLEGTLETNPSSNDWFPIYLGTKNPYKQYPIIESSPTGLNGNGDTGNDGFTFRANLLYIRARIDRNYLNAETYDQNLYGSIDKVLINI
jgi:hypothetical protein